MNYKQAIELDISKPKDVKGMSIYDCLLDEDEATNLVKNDREVMINGGTRFFVEGCTFFKNGKTCQYFSIKTTLNDSCNRVIGCFGISCRIEGSHFACFLGDINKLDLPFNSDMCSIALPPILNNNFPGLSDLELECVSCLVRNMSCEQIAHILESSRMDIEACVDGIKNKLGCTNNLDIVSKVFDWMPSVF